MARALTSTRVRGWIVSWRGAIILGLQWRWWRNSETVCTHFEWHFEECPTHSIPPYSCSKIPPHLFSLLAAPLLDRPPTSLTHCCCFANGIWNQSLRRPCHSGANVSEVGIDCILSLNSEIQHIYHVLLSGDFCIANLVSEEQISRSLPFFGDVCSTVQKCKKPKMAPKVNVFTPFLSLQRDYDRLRRGRWCPLFSSSLFS